MIDRELGRLKRAELLELLIEQAKEAERLKKELADAQKLLESREIKLEQAGSIAEAALQVNGVFEAAQDAAAQYLENIETLSEKQEAICAKREEESVRKAEQMLSEAQAKAEQMLTEAQAERDKAQRECAQTDENVRKQCEELAERTRKQCEELIRRTKQQCEDMKQEADFQVEEKWKNISNRLEEFYKAHEDLRELLTF